MAYKEMIPERDDQKYWLNEWGSRYWISKTIPYLYVHRPYYWCDIVSFIDESKIENGYIPRKYVKSMKFSEFILQENDWIIMDIKYERKQKLEKLLQRHNG